jgi:hypothetical protein
MNFLFKTKVTWIRPKQDDETLLINTTIDQMFADGKTDGAFEMLSDDVAIRNWVSEEAALEWKAFIETLAPPILCEILPNS